MIPGEKIEFDQGDNFSKINSPSISGNSSDIKSDLNIFFEILT